MENQIERAQFLARFKLQVRRTIGQSVDLDRLTRDPAYARQRLSEIEEAADEEELLISVLRMRDLLLPVTPEVRVEPVVETVAVAPDVTKQTTETRNYLMGARAWR
ncbi:hypothetical protein [Dechloromonas sp. HYN0024]|uniref:hypothetical protein n=1 Tax=Dechloromonas sp. HYN0024 TaxID=2231055 RepID=UPI000E44C889|nr:hypothetical protein [Dechloromonas sp. HYN0024]AXS80955.1 hypothetical protein HYN24_13545 [Dechloromonas sp. HYN0024]